MQLLINAKVVMLHAKNAQVQQRVNAHNAQQLLE